MSKFFLSIAALIISSVSAVATILKTSKPFCMGIVREDKFKTAFEIHYTVNGLNPDEVELSVQDRGKEIYSAQSKPDGFHYGSFGD